MPHTRPGRVYLLTLGCAKNQVDSEGIAEQLADAGYQMTSRAEWADYLIVNTCGFLQAAQHEAVETLRQLAAAKRPAQRLIAAGCLAQRSGSDLARQVPGVDGIIGVRSWSDMPAFLRELSLRPARPREPIFHLPDTGALPVERVPLRRTNPGRRASAYLKIGDGCSARCAFCAIPIIKGPARSRPRELILREAGALVGRGVREIILIAQDTTAYGRDDGSPPPCINRGLPLFFPPKGGHRRAQGGGEPGGLPALIEDILGATPDLRWLRLMYTYPGHADRRLIEVMAAHPQVCHYLDMPIQHGHPDTLRRMRRPHSVDKLLRWIEALRAAVPDVALRTSLIVGFPGETEAEFQGLLDFMQAVQFDRAGVFTYSREPGTAAYAMPNQVPEEVKQARYEQAMHHQQAISLAKNQAQLGRTLEVLVEGCGDGISVARSYRDAPEVDGFVLIQAEHPVDSWLSVRITSATEYDLVGDTCEG